MHYLWYRACLFGPVVVLAGVDKACLADRSDVGTSDSELLELCGGRKQGVECHPPPRLLQVKAVNMAAVQVFEELQVSQRRSKAARLGMRETRAARHKFRMNMSAAARASAAAAAAVEATPPQLQHTDLARSTQLLSLVFQPSAVGSRIKFGFSNLFEQLDVSRSSRSRWGTGPAKWMVAVMLIVFAVVAAYACVFHTTSDDETNPTRQKRKSQQQRQQQPQTFPYPEFSNSTSPSIRRGSGSILGHLQTREAHAWTLAQAETPEVHRGGIMGPVGVSYAPSLCSELLIPQNCESALLMPRQFPPVGELQGRILIEDVEQSPIFHATYYLRPRRGEHTDLLPQPSRLVLASAADDFVYASCIDAHSKATSPSGLGLQVQDDRGRDFGMLTPNGRSEKSGFILKTHTDLQVSWIGDHSLGKLNCVDQNGMLLATTDPHGPHQVIRIGYGTDSGLILLCLLGVELLRQDLRSTSMPI